MSSEHRILSPSRRPCIKGPNCCGKCCTMKVKKVAGVRRENYPGPGGDKAHYDSLQIDSNSDLSSDEPGEDTVDGENIYSRKRQIEQSSTYDHDQKLRNRKNRLQNDDMTPVLTNTYLLYTPEGAPKGALFKQNDRSTRVANADWASSPNPYNPVKNQTVSKFWLIAIIAVVILFYAFYIKIMIVEYTQNDFKKELRSIGDEYKISKDVMLRIQNGIESTFKQLDAVSIMLLYRKFNKQNLSEFVNKVANASAKYLRTGSGNPLILKRSDLTMDSDQELLSKYRERFESQGVMLFQNVEDLPVNLAKAFHYYCDEHNPIAKKTAVFFTLDLTECKGYIDKNQYKVVENCLKDKWEEMSTDDLMPLLSRVINIVVDLESQ